MLLLHAVSCSLTAAVHRCQPFIVIANFGKLVEGGVQEKGRQLKVSLQMRRGNEADGIFIL